jgi:tagatose-1,6-bisphosphate aldolase non-catalytic subunit AgaZ/GatZ
MRTLVDLAAAYGKKFSTSFPQLDDLIFRAGPTDYQTPRILKRRWDK